METNLILHKKLYPVFKYFCCFIVLLLSFVFVLQAQQPDSLHIQKDSIVALDSFRNNQYNLMQELLGKNFLINVKGNSFHYLNTEKENAGKDTLFYLIAGLLFSFGLFRMLNNKYFVNIGRVFFNNTLRQSQLVDQLLQAKLPSLFMNLFFATVSGFYIFLNLVTYDKIKSNNWTILSFCISFFLVIYSIKYLSLKFFGWLVDSRNEADNYIFIVFLLNKIIGILLLPMICIMAFVDKKSFDIILVGSYFIIGLMLVLRYLRSYNALRYSLKVSRFHFILYVIGIEILPIFLIYKEAMIILNKNM